MLVALDVSLESYTHSCGSRVVTSAGSEAALWNATDAQKICTLTHGVVTASQDRTASIWSAANVWCLSLIHI